MEVPGTMALRIRKGDLVQVVSGADKGKQGRVLAVDRAAGKVRVEKVRVQKRHLKPGRKGMRSGGIVEQEGFLDVSTVMLVDPGSQAPSRVRIETRGGKRVRVFAKSGTAVPEPPAR
jgi:large subunit ribosomal protein L24